jgi:hypothetical protein
MPLDSHCHCETQTVVIYNEKCRNVGNSNKKHGDSESRK